MVKSDVVPADGDWPPLALLRQSGDALEVSAPAFDAAAAAPRLREAAQARGLLQPEGAAYDDAAVTGAALDEAPVFDVEDAAARLRQAAVARGLLSSSVRMAPRGTVWTKRRDQTIHRRRVTAPTSKPQILHERYRLGRRLGAGGMGSVWLAEDLQLERTVALKELVRYGTDADLAERQSRALLEARALARVRHPAIVSIYDIFFAGDDPWIVMDYISGESLDAILREQPQLDEQVIAAIGLQVVGGLSAAHQAGVVHRDVKPANILVTADASVYLVDFGIAQVAGDPSFTDRQAVVGTIDFLAPERLHGDTAQPAADLWALGVTLFCALEGHPPFRRETAGNTMRAILHDDPTRPTRQGPLADVVLRLLAKDPAMRAEADELADALRAIAARVKPQDSESKVPPQPAAARRSRPTEIKLAGLSFEDAREVILKVRPDTAAAMLAAMPDDQTGRLLVSYPPNVRRKLLQGIAVARPDKAGKILRLLKTSDASQMLAHLESRTAAAVLDSIPPSEGARVLSSTDRIIAELPVRISAALITGMKTGQIAEILAHINPATVASLLLSAPSTVTAAILGQLNPALRAQVARSLARENRMKP
jgi:serine/threonine protein kinase